MIGWEACQSYRKHTEAVYFLSTVCPYSSFWKGCTAQSHTSSFLFRDILVPSCPLKALFLSLPGFSGKLNFITAPFLKNTYGLSHGCYVTPFWTLDLSLRSIHTVKSTVAVLSVILRKPSSSWHHIKSSTSPMAQSLCIAISRLLCRLSSCLYH